MNNKEITQNLAKNILFLRKKLNFSQKNLADLLKVSTNKVKRWETGISKISLVDLCNLCLNLNIKIDYILQSNKIFKKYLTITKLKS